MASTWGIDHTTQELFINQRYELAKIKFAEAYIYKSAVERAERLLAKILVRRWLHERSLEQVAASIDLNKIIAQTLKINLNFGDQNG